MAKRTLPPPAPAKQDLHHHQAVSTRAVRRVVRIVGFETPQDVKAGKGRELIHEQKVKRRNRPAYLVNTAKRLLKEKYPNGKPEELKVETARAEINELMNARVKRTIGPTQFKKAWYSVFPYSDQ